MTCTFMGPQPGSRMNTSRDYKAEKSGTFAWLLMFRRLSQDYEELPATSEAFIYLAMSRLMVKRLAHA